MLDENAGCMVYPACYSGANISERRSIYAENSKGLTLKDLPVKLAAKNDEGPRKGKALFPGPNADGSMRNDKFKTELQNAMSIGSSASGQFTCYWFLTDNSKDSEVPDEFLDYIIRGEPSFSQVFFIPLGELQSGRAGLALYVLIQKNGSSEWTAEWSEKFAKAVDANLADVVFSSSTAGIKRQLIDLRGVIKPADGAQGTVPQLRAAANVH